MQSFFGSLVPAAFIAALFGTQYQKAALRVVPPSCDAFSRTRTLSPCQQVKSAVASPATPLPMTMTSNSPSNLPFAAAGAADLRAIVAIASSLLPEKESAIQAQRSFNFSILTNPENAKQNGYLAVGSMGRMR